MKVTNEDINNLIAGQLQRPDLSAEDVLLLTIARRLNGASENTFAAAMGSADSVALGVRRGKRRGSR